jgi:hypothetical protein
MYKEVLGRRYRDVEEVLRLAKDPDRVLKRLTRYTID